jgi:hypothetical protein
MLDDHTELDSLLSLEQSSNQIIFSSRMKATNKLLLPHAAAVFILVQLQPTNDSNHCSQPPSNKQVA